jgi:hypothetical protein
LVFPVVNPLKATSLTETFPRLFNDLRISSSEIAAFDLEFKFSEVLLYETMIIRVSSLDINSAKVFGAALPQKSLFK